MSLNNCQPLAFTFNYNRKSSATMAFSSKLHTSNNLAPLKLANSVVIRTGLVRCYDISRSKLLISDMARSRCIGKWPPFVK